MEDDLELRRYIRAILRLGWFVVVLTLLAGAAGFGYASLKTVTYQATTLLSVGRPLFALNLEAIDQSPQVPVRLYADLALSDEVLQTLSSQLQAAGRQPPSLVIFRTRLAANAATDTGLLRLAAIDTTGDGAVQIANLWADIILAQSAALYGPNSPQMVSYQAQLETARATLESADAARAAYQGRNQVGLLEAQLGSLKSQLTAALDRQTRYTLLADDARSLQARLAAQTGTAPASTSDEAALLLLVAEAANAGLPLPFNSSGDVTTDTGTNVDIIQQSQQPLQVQISIASGASSQTVNALAKAVDTFVTDLTTRAAAAGSLAATLGPQMLQLQTALAEANAAAEQYNMAVGLANGQYTSLAGQVNQAAIAAQDAADLVRVASPATIPILAGSSHRLTTAAIGAIAGLIVAILIIVALEWWRTPLPARRAAATAADQTP